MSPLSEKKCASCQGNGLPLKGDALQNLHRKITGWELVDDHHIKKNYTFKNFKEALAFTNTLGAIAEQEGHHPEITLTWGKVTVKIWTHNIDGLTESDFILAAKYDDRTS